MVIEAPPTSSSSSVHPELLPALACEGFTDAFKEAAASVSGFRLRFSVSAHPLLMLAVLSFPLFCLCLQGWPMNRQ